MCRECRQIANENEKVYYKDPMCIVIKGDNNEVVSIYAYHHTPNSRDEQWVAVKGEVIAKKRFGSSIVEAREYQGHFKVIFKPMPDIRVSKNSRLFDSNQRRCLE